MPSVQRPELTTALTNWQQRAQYYNRLGIPQSQWYQIATNDIQNVANTGAQPMSTSEVNAAMASQLAGRSIIGNPQHHSHGLFGDIAHAVASIPSDVGELITGALPGAAHFVAHFPSELHETGSYLLHTGDANWLTQHGYQDPHGSFLHHFAADIANMAHTPILSLLPGVADVGNLTTPSGRQYLLSHPVTAALDVAPAGKIAGAATRAVTAPAEAESALGRLQAGRPISAAYKASQRVPQIGAMSDALSRRHILDSLGVGEQAKAMSRGHSETAREYSRKIERILRPLNEHMKKMSLAERKAITDEATGLTQGAMTSARNEAAVMLARQLRDTFRSFGEQEFRTTRGKDGLITLKWGQRRLTFSADDPMARVIKKRNAILSKFAPARRRRISQGMRAEQRARDRVDALQKELNDARVSVPPMPTQRLERDLREAQAKHLKTKTYLTTQVARYQRLKDQLSTLRKEMYERLYEGGGSAEMHPRVETQLRAAAVQARHDMFRHEITSLKPLNDPTHPLYNPDSFLERAKHALRELHDDVSGIREASNIQQIKTAFSRPAERIGNPRAMAYARAQYDALLRDVTQNVLDLVARGLDPVWMKHIDPGQEARFEARFGHKATIIPDHVDDITQYNRRTFNFAPRVSDVALGMSAAARDLLSSKGTDLFLRSWILPRAKTTGELEEQYLKLSKLDIDARRRLPTRDIRGHAQALMEKEWETLNPQWYGLRDWGGYGRFSKSDQIMVPKWMAKNMRSLMPSKDPARYEATLLPHATYDRALKVFRFSVLTGPRHLVHVAIAGLVPLMAREPLAPLHFRRALQTIREVKDGQHEKTYARAVKNLYDFTDGVYNKAVGAQLGGWLRQFWEQTGQNAQRRLAKLEETVSDMYRVSSMLAAEKRGLSHEEALALGNKVAVDMDDMAPIERQILRHVFPFYGFTKFMFRYLLTYPVDHPYRVTIISRFATQEQQDWNTLLPEKFMMTLFLGHPDEHGNIRTVDLRNLNPFRSFSNDFTLVGFFQSLNPILTTPLTMRGFDVLNATGPLYPSLQFDAVSGTLKAAPPSGRDQFWMGVQQFIPEVGALDHFVGLTDQMRTLKKTSPAAYRAQLFSNLNLPGILSPPITVNQPYVEERQEIARYKAAQQSVSSYEEGKPSATPPTSYNVVPYQGQYVDPAAFEAYWQQLMAASPSGINPRALVSTPRTRTSQSPLELLTGFGGQLPEPPPTNY